MKPRLYSFACAALIVALLTMACAKPPTEQINDATEAVARAENDIDAITYAGNSIARARDALARMQTEVDSKRYDSAKSYAAEAIAAAERAVSEGRAGAERARTEAAALVTGLPPLVAETGQGIGAAFAADLDLDFDSLNRNFDTACRTTEQAQEALSDSRYEDAIRLGRSARSELTGINQQLSSAAMSGSRKK